MDYSIVPTLKCLANFATARILWKTNDRAYTPRTRLTLTGYWYQRISLAERKVTDLNLPEEQDSQLHMVLYVVHCQIYTWLWEHYVLLKTIHVENVMDRICWTMQGTIDKRRTAETFLLDERVDASTRFDYACHSCVEDFIRRLWSRTYVTSGWCKTFRVASVKLVRYWDDIYCGSRNRDILSTAGIVVPNSPSIEQNPSLLRHCVVAGNEEAVKYLWPVQSTYVNKVKLALLAVKCRWRHSDGILPGNSHNNILVFLLGQMSAMERERVFAEEPRLTLKCFLDWPWTNVFLKVAKNMLHVFSTHHCGQVLMDIADIHEELQRNTIYIDTYSDLFAEFASIANYM